MRLLKFFFSDFSAKFVALLLAVFIWILAVLFRTNKITVNIPVEFSNQPSEVVITEYSPDKVTLELEGQGSELVKLIFKQPKYRLNLMGLRYGRHFYRTNPADVIVPAAILIKSLAPETIFLKADFLARKPVKIFVPYKIDFSPDIYISEVKVLEDVILEGPESKVTQIWELETESLRITSKESLPVYKRLQVLLPEKQTFRVRPESVLVSVQLEQKITKTFDSIPIQLIRPSQAVIKINPALAKLTISGPESKINNLSPDEIIIQINLSELKAGRYKLPAEIVLPKNIYLERCEPKLFEVEIREHR
ncbi:MAG: CdaR family protein [candidate division WOR-3 bacterium]